MNDSDSDNGSPAAGENLPVMTGSALGTLVRAEIDVQIATAKQYPRSLARFKKDALAMATLNEDIAAACFYALPRGGKTISGPSVRLAEIVATAWGNLRFEARIIADDGKMVTARGACHDLERNVAGCIETKRRVTNKEGKRFSDDMIVVTSNAACAIAKREAIFGVVPRCYVKEIEAAARQVAIGDAKTLVSKRADMMAYFGKMGLDEARICAAVGKAALEDIGLDDLAVLKGLATSIKDGDINVDEAFPPMQVAPRADKKPEPNGSKTDRLADKIGAAASTKPEEPQPSKEESSKETPADQDQGGTQDAHDELAEKIAAATGLKDMELIGRELTRQSEWLGPERHAALVEQYKQRQAQLAGQRTRRTAAEI